MPNNKRSESHLSPNRIFHEQAGGTLCKSFVATSRMNAFTSPTGYPYRLLLCVTDEDNRGQKSIMVCSVAREDDDGILDPTTRGMSTVQMNESLYLLN